MNTVSVTQKWQWSLWYKLRRAKQLPAEWLDTLALWWLVYHARKTNLDFHARTEMKAIGYDPTQEDGPNRWMLDAVLQLCATFSAQGHSGFSANVAVQTFAKLAKFEPLAALTGEDWEWHEVGDNLYQNKRCSHVFKRDGVSYDCEGIIFRDPDGGCYINGESRVDVVFPYTPTRKYVDRPLESDHR